MVFLYSLRLSLRKIGVRSRLTNSAATACSVIQSITDATALGSGCFSFLGGISWLLRTLTTSRHLDRVAGSEKSIDKSLGSMAKLPLGFSPV